MYFKAKSGGFKYEFNVRELDNSWHVDIKKENENWKKHVVPKEDYRYTQETISFIYNNRSYLLDVIEENDELAIYTRGVFRTIKVYNDQTILHENLKSRGKLSGDTELTTGMPGKIIDVTVKAGDKVKEGESLVIMEAMKMENEMRAASDAIVKDVHVKKGDNVEGGTLLISFEVK